MVQCVNDIWIVRSSNARKSSMKTWSMQNFLWRGKFARQVSSMMFSFLVFFFVFFFKICFVCSWIWKNSVELLLLFSNRCCLLFFCSCLHFEFIWQFYIYSLEYYSYSYIIRLRLRWFLVVLFAFWCCCCCSCVYFWAIFLENVFDILTLVELSQQLVLWLVLQGHQGVGCQGLVSQVETVARWVSEDWKIVNKCQQEYRNNSPTVRSILGTGYTPALDLLHALQMIIPGLLCVVVSWNCEGNRSNQLIII